LKSSNKQQAIKSQLRYVHQLIKRTSNEADDGYKKYSSFQEFFVKSNLQRLDLLPNSSPIMAVFIPVQTTVNKIFGFPATHRQRR
jgi:hypothetical protein